VKIKRIPQVLLAAFLKQDFGIPNFHHKAGKIGDTNHLPKCNENATLPVYSVRRFA
jgi:hypothetical protein